MANRITRHIPNAITCCNLFSGCMAVVCAAQPLQYDVRTAFLWILAGAGFDFCDGMSARLLKAFSPIGKDLDSLADMVTFGLAPSIICMKMLSGMFPAGSVVPYLAFSLAIAAGIRLAKFNNDTRQTSSFLGLAVPANAIFWGGIALWVEDTASSSTSIGWSLVLMMFSFALLMDSETPMFSLKFKNLSWKDNSIRFIFLLGAALFILVFGLKGTAPTIVWYILLSLITGRKA